MASNDIVYPYRDADSHLVYEVVRKANPKNFLQRHSCPGKRGGLVWNLGGDPEKCTCPKIKPLLYRFPELIAADPTAKVFIVEGEKDVDRLRSLGFVATCNSGGAGKWEPRYREHVNDRPVVIIADNDEPGLKHALSIAQSTHDEARSVQVLYLPDINEGGDVSDWLDEVGTVEGLKRLAAEADEWIPEDEEPEKPVINITGSRMWEIADASIGALIKTSGDKPEVYQRGDKLVRLRTGTGMSAQALDAISLRGILDRRIDYVKLANGNEIPARPPGDVIADILSLPNPGFPWLQGFHSAPVFLQDGRLLNRNGYDPESGLYMTLFGLEGIRSDMPLEEARYILLEDLLGDFPFPDPGSKAHILALLLQGFSRAMIYGPTPLYLIDAPARGNGKGLAMEVISIVTLGHTPDVMVLPREEDELEKRITATLVEGRPLIVMDNVTVLESSTLAAVLTTTNWLGRWLGKSEMVQAPNTATWVSTGNNVGVSDEMGRRILPIRLDSGEERPESRVGFRHPQLAQWSFANRERLVSACISIIMAWVNAGMPRYTGKGTLGRFESYVEVMGGILEVAGVEGFLGNRETLYAVADSDTVELKSLCEAWWAVHGERPITAKSLLQVAKDSNLCLRIWAGKSDISAQQRWGNELRRLRDKVYGGYRIRHAGEASGTGSHQYRLEQKREGGTEQTTETTETPSSEPVNASAMHVISTENQVMPSANQVDNIGMEPVVSGVSGVSHPPSENAPERDIRRV